DPVPPPADTVSSGLVTAAPRLASPRSRSSPQRMPMVNSYRTRPGSALLGGVLLWAVGLTLLLYYLLFYLHHAAVLAQYPFDVDQGEGYDVNSGWLLWQGHSIYNDNSS